MGICLDTEQNNEEVEPATGEQTRGGSSWVGRATPPTATFPMQNTSHVKFEPPAVPVIFVLGGPGSGKVTHCDNLMQERRGVVHINMTDLLQQYAIGNGTLSPRTHDDMQDFGTLSSKTVTEVLMLEMKMAPTAKSYLVSGYPRSMRDVAEYSDKIQTINGVVLVSWRQRVLERQIEYGARLGHVVLSLARMELKNFYKNVMPVADYFDQSNMLIAVNGERNPEEVYKDFRAAILQVLGSLEEQNGVNGVGVGAGGRHSFIGIPGEIVGIERVLTPPAPEPSVIPIAPPIVQPISVPPAEPLIDSRPKVDNLKPELIRVKGASGHPIILWVVGGPGSNKAVLCQRAVTQNTGWAHFSVGQRVRALADAGGSPASDGAMARMTLSNGELSPKELVYKIVRNAVTEAVRNGQGLVLDGYPRDLEQLEAFEREFQVEPRMVLLDCSKLQLGRGRRDDSVAAFRRRLEVFRELSLPMLKNLDSNHRLVIVDGDTDSPDVQQEFTRILAEEMEKAVELSRIPRPTGIKQPIPNTNISTMRQFAHAVSRMGGGMVTGGQNGMANGHLPNGVANGYVPMGNNKINPMPKLPTVSQVTHDDVRRMYEQSSGEVTMNTHM